MKNMLFLICAVCALLANGYAQEAKDVSQNIRTMLEDRMCPQPASSKFFDGFFVLAPESKIEIATSVELTAEQKTEIAAIFNTYWKFAPKTEYNQDSSLSKISPEGCGVKISNSAISITAANFSGVRYALSTLRQLGEAEHGTNNFVFQCAEINDAPALKFRGIHICVFPETTLVALEKYIRLAAYYKFNYIIIECWGTFPFKTHPELCFQDKKLDRAEFKRLINLCYSLGITPVPQFSILGHAAQCRNHSAKHVVLPMNPELAELFEPGGWSWCMCNPKSKQVLKEAVAEIHEFFGNPPYFHIGCDEAYDMGTCYECRNKNIAELFSAHLKYFDEFLAERGARPIMWHDMLLDEHDPRWAKFVATGTKEMAETLKTMPKNIIIADWQYSDRDAKTSVWPTPKYFKDAGFDVIVCPWENLLGIKTLGETAKSEKLFGFLSTTWHHVSGDRLKRFFFAASNAAWGGAQLEGGFWQRTRTGANRHIQTVEADMGITKYEDLGTSALQIQDL